MAAFLTMLLSFVVAVSSQAPTPGHPATVSAKNGEVVIGRVSGGSFGPGSFTVGENGRNVTGGVGGQGEPNPPHVTADGSIAIDSISGGNHPDGSFSVGHGQNSPSGGNGGNAGNAGKDANAPDSATSSKLSWLCSILVVFILSICV